MLTIDYNLLTLSEAIILLTEYDGYMDGDSQCIKLHVDLVE